MLVWMSVSVPDSEHKYIYIYIGLYKYIFTYSNCFCIKRFVFKLFMENQTLKKQAGPRFIIFTVNTVLKMWNQFRTHITADCKILVVYGGWWI